jgi:hypothetical protein
MIRKKARKGAAGQGGFATLPPLERVALTQPETPGRAACGRPFSGCAHGFMANDGTPDWADRVGGRIGIVALLAAMFAYGYLGPLFGGG